MCSRSHVLLAAIMSKSRMAQVKQCMLTSITYRYCTVASERASSCYDNAMPCHVLMPIVNTSYSSDQLVYLHLFPSGQVFSFSFSHSRACLRTRISVQDVYQERKGGRSNAQHKSSLPISATTQVSQQSRSSPAAVLQESAARYIAYRSPPLSLSNQASRSPLTSCFNS